MTEQERKIDTGGGNYYESSIRVGPRGKFVGGNEVTQQFHAQQGVTLAEFTALLAELRGALPASGLDAQAVEVIDAEAQVVEEQAASPEPDGEIIVSRLETITKLLTAVSGTVVAAKALLPTAQTALEWAQQLFK